MKQYKTVTVEKLEVKKVYCNCCGKEIKRDKHGELEEYISVHKKWGYNSNFDGEEHTIDICCKCYQQWLEKFKIKPSNKQE